MLHIQMAISVHMSDGPESLCCALCEKTCEYCLMLVTRRYEKITNLSANDPIRVTSRCDDGGVDGVGKGVVNGLPF